MTKSERRRVCMFVFFGVVLFALVTTLGKRLINNNAVALHGSANELAELRVAKLLEQPSAYTALAIGNSHTLAIDFETLEVDGYYLWHEGRDLFEIEYQLAQLLPQLENLETVYVPVSYFLFDWDTAAQEALTQDRIIMYRSTLGTWPIATDRRNFVSAVLQKAMPVNAEVRDVYLSGLGFQLAQTLGIPYTQEGRYQLRADGLLDQPHWHGCGYMEPDALETFTREKTVYGHLLALEEIKSTRPDVRQDSYDALLRLSNFAAAHNIELVLFTPPYTDSYNRLIGEDVITGMETLIQQAQLETGLTYVDFSRTDLSFDHTLFMDSDHMNKCGAQAFSAQLKDALNKR